MDLRGASDEDVRYIRWALGNEGNAAYLQHLDEEGWNLRQQPIEWAVYEPKQSAGLSGLDIGPDGETSLPGLLAAGDVAGAVPRSVCPGALTFGHRVGESAASFLAESGRVSWGPEAESMGERVAERAEKFLGRTRGATWDEALIAFQNVMHDYGGYVRSATLLNAGLGHLDRLRERIESEGYASNPHELYRMYEVLNLLEVGRLIMRAALHREESRGEPWSRRVDYPDQDDERWRRLVTVWQEEGAIRWGEIPLPV